MIICKHVLHKKQFIFMISRKCVVVGDEKTGKTALIEQLLHRSVVDTYKPTVVSIASKEYSRNTKKAELIVTEIGGTINSVDLRLRYYRNCDFILLVFNLTDKSFDNLPRWISEINMIRPNVTKILIGTNAEKEKRVVDFQTVKKFVTLNYINRYYEISNKDATNIRELLHHVFIPLLFDKSACDDPKPADASNFKVCLWGSSGSGKTTFRRTLCGGSPEPSYYAESRGILKLLGKHWNVCIAEQYDGCDDLRFLALDGFNLLLIICDLTDRNSLSRILSYNLPAKFPTVLVGLKSDIYDKKDPNAVDNEDIDELMATTNAILYAEGCAKNANDCIQIIEEAMSAALEWYETPENQIQ